MNTTAYFRHPFAYAAGVDQGRVRTANQDAVICCPAQGFFAVADGMGGLEGGGEASRMLGEILPAALKRLAATLPEGFGAELAGAALLQVVANVSDSIYARTNVEGAISFGSTLCAIWLVESCAVCVNIGDSRAYHFRPAGAALTQLSGDHNLAAAMVKAGYLTPEEALQHPSSAKLTRFMGMRAPAAPELFYKRVQKGDKLLLCSDGLYGMAKAPALCALLRRDAPPEACAQAMIACANEQGGRDNIALVLITI